MCRKPEKPVTNRALFMHHPGGGVGLGLEQTFSLCEIWFTPVHIIFSVSSHGSQNFKSNTHKNMLLVHTGLHKFLRRGFTQLFFAGSQLKNLGWKIGVGCSG